jgi:hypothetical protein
MAEDLLDGNSCVVPSLLRWLQGDGGLAYDLHVVLWSSPTPKRLPEKASPRGLSMHHSAKAPRSHRCRETLVLASLLGLTTAVAGCQTLTTAKGGVDTATSTVQSTQSTAGTVKQVGGDLKGEADKLMGKKADGSPAGPGEKQEDEGRQAAASQNHQAQPAGQR